MGSGMVEVDLGWEVAQSQQAVPLGVMVFGTELVWHLYSVGTQAVTSAMVEQVGGQILQPGGVWDGGELQYSPHINLASVLCPAGAENEAVWQMLRTESSPTEGKYAGIEEALLLGDRAQLHQLLQTRQDLTDSNKTKICSCCSFFIGIVTTELFTR
eukprot:g31654.t1